MQKINPFLWFDTQAEEAANFYVSVFSHAFESASADKKSEVISTARYGEAGPGPKGSVMIMTFKLLGQDFISLNGGPVKDFVFTPCISFYIPCKTEKEVDTLWKNFSTGGKVLMELNKYPFSQKYGWIQDRYGVSWQLNLTGEDPHINPLLMFVQELNGQAETAINFYTLLFKDSKINKILPFPPGQDNEGKVMHSSFIILGQEFMAMDGGKNHNFNFTPSISFFINCETQLEVDEYWDKLSSGGEKSQCGWLKDKFGISWQVVPTILGKLMSDPDPEKSKRVMQAMLKMTKLKIDELQQAYDNA
jgi:predicted 3-demethylubiquinone-9 3-methyltransferase (glyoxalase superfamily)